MYRTLQKHGGIYVPRIICPPRMASPTHYTTPHHTTQLHYTTTQHNQLSYTHANSHLGGGEHIGRDICQSMVSHAVFIQLPPRIRVAGVGYIFCGGPRLPHDPGSLHPPHCTRYPSTPSHTTSSLSSHLIISDVLLGLSYMDIMKYLSTLPERLRQRDIRDLIESGVDLLLERNEE